MTSFYNKISNNNTLNYCNCTKESTSETKTKKKTYYLIRRWCNCRNELLQNY